MGSTLGRSGSSGQPQRKGDVELAPFKRDQEWIPRFERIFTSAGTALVIVGLHYLDGSSDTLSFAKRNGLVLERL